VTDLYPDLRGEPPDALETPERVLAVGAHPDDIEFGAGGTLAKWTQEGAVLTLVVVTDGSKGTWDPEADPAAVSARRKSEQRAAAEELGATGVAFLDRPDGELEYSLALREEIAGWIRRERPDVLFTHDPWQRYQLHPDHRITGLLTVDAVVAARDPLFYRDQLVAGVTHHRPEAVLLWSADEPNHWEDIGDTLDRKVAALLCHSSQGETTMGGIQDSAAARRAFSDRVQSWAERAGEATGFQAGEAFRRLTP
jgi:LmbE family N-acetylglucosaminyl deacetylase